MDREQKLNRAIMYFKMMRDRRSLCPCRDTTEDMVSAYYTLKNILLNKPKHKFIDYTEVYYGK